MRPATWSRSARRRWHRRRPAGSNGWACAKARASKQGEVLARLENRDVSATMEQAAASIKVAQANLEQGQAELNEAERNFNRSRDLLAKNFVSQAAHDAAVSRFEKAKSAISGYRASIAVAQANYRGDRGGRRADADPRAVRRRGADEKCQRRRRDHAVLVGAGFAGGGGDDGRHVDARSRGRRVGIQPRQDQARSAVRDPARRAARTCGFAAACCAWCRRSIAPRRR